MTKTVTEIGKEILVLGFVGENVYTFLSHILSNLTYILKKKLGPNGDCIISDSALY